MSTIDGFQNEYEFVKYFNHTLVKNLDPVSRSLIDYLFPDNNEDDEIKCWRNHYAQKSDIFLKIKNKMQGVSIKKGIKNSVHVEPISEFIHFLITNNIDRKYINFYLKFHYADGTTNGSGKRRENTIEYKNSHQAEIDELNNVLNNENIINKAIDRFIIKGNNSNYDISALIYGEFNDYIWISKENIRKIIIKNKDIYSSAVHISSLVIQPKNRCLNYNPKYEKDRYSIQVKWYSLFDDIIASMYDNNGVV